jgi:hypothetical protein
VLDTQQHYNPNDGWDTEERESWSLALCPGGESSASHGSNDLNCSKWNVEKDGVEGVEAERVDDQGAEGRDTPTRDSVIVST